MTYLHEMPILTQFLVYAIILYTLIRISTDVFNVGKYIVDRYFNNRYEVIKLEAERKYKILKMLETIEHKVDANSKAQEVFAKHSNERDKYILNQTANIGRDVKEVCLYLMALAREVDGQGLADNFFNYYAPKEIKQLANDDEVQDA